MARIKYMHLPIIPVGLHIYSGVRVIATRILHEISLLIGELAIRGTKLTLNGGLGKEIKLPLEQLLLGEHYCI